MASAPATSDRTATIAALDDEDRHHGRVALLLLASWHDWVKRRVEAVHFLNMTTCVRRVSIDFRLRSWLPAPELVWNDVGMHYFPLALLEKRTLEAFDVRDENGQALPLLTRRKNAAIAAGSLVALAQFSVVEHIGRARVIGPQQSSAPLPNEVDARRIKLPQALEDDLWRLSYLNWSEPTDSADAKRVLEGFHAPPAMQTAAAAWRWRELPDGSWEPEGVDPSVWRWQLIADSNFRELAGDFARVFMVSVPIAHESKRRRIVKLRYQQHLAEPQVKVLRRLKRVGTRVNAERWLTRIEDWCEALPRSDRRAIDEWQEPTTPTGVPPRDLNLLQKIGRSIAWASTSFTFDVPAVGEAGSFHFEVQAPEGLQIRRATLTAHAEGCPSQGTVRRGVRTLQRVHLHLRDVPAGAWGAATVALKPRAPTLIRGNALGAGLIALGLIVAAAFFIDKLRTTEDLGAIVGALLIVPGLLAVISVRSSEHPLTTSVLFGVRMVTLLSGASAVSAAVLLVAGRGGSAFRPLWIALSVLALLMFVLLAWAWRLAARRRPSGRAP